MNLDAEVTELANVLQKKLKAGRPRRIQVGVHFPNVAKAMDVLENFGYAFEAEFATPETLCHQLIFRQKNGKTKPPAR